MRCDQLRELSGGKPVGMKMCVGQPAEVAALVHAMLDTGITPDFITIDGAEGGTGAAPLEFQNSIGFPLAEGLRLVNSLLTGAGLRKEVVNAARAFMFGLGCIQALQCNR